ncbi:hypothetical protein SAMN06265339_1245 [Desulfurobacterium pacificum]|uniref:PIN domain-containing protein n=1 Tax=Desulfurobacterium pacificum TaxID=240166 RepID=A0ABY1NNF5_9BACT|nr:type II toxin-antitoxin system VapC family toxin [Desulfurobacterium pacificum]SMP14018.1 hypothetical protein SAMN06265339_1245 [Desulfurobacterium pacificum]
MKRNRLLLDTNAVLYFLSDRSISALKEAFSISFVTEIELLSYPYMKTSEEIKIKEFLDIVKIVDVNKSIKEKTIFLRRKYRLKVPDAIICATAFFLEAILVTNDRQLHRVEEIPVIDYETFRRKYTEFKEA